MPEEKLSIHPLLGYHVHYFTEWIQPHWWSIPHLECKCGERP